MLTYDQYFYTRQGPPIRCLTGPEALVIIVPARRHWFEVLFLFVWLVVGIYVSLEIVPELLALP